MAPAFARASRGEGERVRRGHLVRAVGPDQEEVPDLGIFPEALDELERGQVRPLQIVEEEDERVLRREDLHEALEGQAVAVLRLPRRERRRGGRGPMIGVMIGTAPAMTGAVGPSAS